MTNVEWLFHKEDAASSLRLAQHGRTEIDDAYWRATLERLEIGAGLRVWLSTAVVHKDMTVQPRDQETEPWISAGVALSGRYEIDMTDGPRARIGPNRAVLFRPITRDPPHHVRGRQRLRVASYSVRADRVRRAFDDNVPPALLPMLTPDFGASHVIEVPATQRLRRLADQMFAPGLNGPLRLLFIEGAVLQLLALKTAAGPQQAASRATLSPREQDALAAARERLLADMRTPPTLGELAAAVGLTEKRLNAGFRARFGGTVFEILRNERLEHARIALETGAVSLKQVAYRVGYNHVTNFINAFTARYGAPPRRYADESGEQAPDKP